MKTKVVRTRVLTVTCPECKQELYSRARHDFRYCKCKSTFVDGGLDYLRFGGKDLNTLVKRTRYVPFTPTQLYQDWNQSLNLLGVINAKS